MSMPVTRSEIYAPFPKRGEVKQLFTVSGLREEVKTHGGVLRRI